MDLSSIAELLESTAPLGTDSIRLREEIDLILAQTPPHELEKLLGDVCDGSATVASLAMSIRMRLPSRHAAAAHAEFTAQEDEDLRALTRIFGSRFSSHDIIAAYQGHAKDLLGVAAALLDAIRQKEKGGVQGGVQCETQGSASAAAQKQNLYEAQQQQYQPQVQPQPPSYSTMTSPSTIADALQKRYPGRFQRQDLLRFIQDNNCTLSDAIALFQSVSPGEERAFFGALGPSTDDPMRPCAICMDSHPLSETYFLACDHSFCYDSIQGHLRSKVDDNVLPRCPDVNCNREISQGDAEQAFPNKTDPILPRIAALFLRVSLAANGAIDCPRPGCQNSFFPSLPGCLEKCSCQACGHVFCSLCKNAFHYDLPCREAGIIAARWDGWLQSGREAFMRAKAAQDKTWELKLNAYQAKKDKHSQDLLQAMARRSELGRDEEWKAANCRLCPHCGRVIERQSGCDSMVCGQDAHGGNQQNGCGRSFNWPSAAPYVARAEGGPQLPAFDETAPQRDIAEIMIIDDFSLPCDHCRKAVTGIGFRCINCPGAYTVCAECESIVTAPGGHNGQHVFRQIRRATDDFVIVDDNDDDDGDLMAL